MVISIVLILGVLALFSKYRFKYRIEAEIASIKNNQAAVRKKIISESDLTGLPEPVVRWLRSNGIIDTVVPSTILIHQTGRLRLKPDQSKWMPFRAQQVVGFTSPSFSWCVQTKLNRFFRIFGRDFFSEEEAALEIRLNNLFPLARKEKCKQMHKSALQRFMMEMIWYPAFALDPRVKWETIDDKKAKALMDLGALKGEVVFEVDAQGDLIKCFAERYYNNGSKSRKYCCVGSILNTQVLSGVRIPTELEITWKLDGYNFNWFKCTVDSVTYL
jgi:hypothetical protein